MGDRFDDESKNREFLDLEKRIERDVSDWEYRKVRHATTDDSIRRYNKIKGTNLTSQ